MLEQIIPFRYLTPEEREALIVDGVEEVFEPGAVLMERGDRSDDRVFLLLEGSVRVRGRDEEDPGETAVVSAGHYIGERAALFDEPRAARVEAVDRVRALTISGDRFRRLVHESTVFAQALGRILRHKQGIFSDFDRFRVALLEEVAEGGVNLHRLIPLYQALRPALHPYASSPLTVDVAALAYAVRRLPEDVPRTFAFYLTDSLPDLYDRPDQRFTTVPTAARRRAVYEMLPGKCMVLVRDGASDLVDFVSCLCLYAIEARKIRRRVRDGGGLDAISPSDVEMLRPVWPEATEERIREMAVHHEDFRIEVHKETDNYNSAHAETWSQEVAEATRALIGYDPADLPEAWSVHVVSSNTHSVPACLSPWLGRNAERIARWARETGHPMVDDGWKDERDMVYAVSRDYLAANPEEGAERARVEREAGIRSLEWTAFTGIAVQLVDAGRVAWDDTDPGIPDVGPDRPTLIVNIDYAFGQQAQYIVAGLVALFGRRLASVNVLGKAGGLVGERGDLLVATGFVEQDHERDYRIHGGNSVDLERLAARLPGRSVHAGRMLTVTGTLLQNRTMLHFNRRIWQCVGLEMEGAWYLDYLEQSIRTGLVPEDIALRFLYYTSDLPLRHDSNLSARMRAAEGVPPLYAATREVLTGILGE